MRVSPTLICSSSSPHQQMPLYVGLEPSHFPSRETEWDMPGNTSRILMTGLQRPGQRGVTMRVAAWVHHVIPNRLMMWLSDTDNRRCIWNHIIRSYTWLWAKLLQEEYPAEGYFMNTRCTPQDVEALQARAREYTRQQVEQMDDWDRAFYREWTSLISRNALAFPYPMGEPIESSKVKLRRSSQRRSVATRDISPQARAHPGRDCVISSPRRQWTSQLGRYNPREQRVLGQDGEGNSHTTGNPISFPYPREGNTEDGTTTSESTQTTIASRTWNSDTLPRGTVVRRDRLTGRTRMVVTGEFIPEGEDPRVSAIDVGTLKATTSDEDKYCMLDSGANVMVVPLMRDMKGNKTMFSLVGDNKTQGLIISRLYGNANIFSCGGRECICSTTTCLLGSYSRL